MATTLALAEQNNARELKRVCLEFVSKHLQAVMASEGYQYMVQTCPQLQAELLQVGASRRAGGGGGVGGWGGALRLAGRSTSAGDPGCMHACACGLELCWPAVTG